MNHTIQEKNILNQLPGFVAWKDTNSIHRGCNTNFAKLVGFETSDAVVGLSDFDMPCDAAKYAVKFIQQDRKVLKGNSLTLLDVLLFANAETKTLITKKQPLITETGNIIGIIWNSLPLDHGFVSEISTTLLKIDMRVRCNSDQGSYEVGGEYLNYKLSPRESECLFYLLRGKTARLTARILDISPKTVAAHLAKIKNKFNYYSKAELIEFSIEKNFLKSIPETLINRETTAALEE